MALRTRRVVAVVSVAGALAVAACSSTAPPLAPRTTDGTGGTGSTTGTLGPQGTAAAVQPAKAISRGGYTPTFSSESCTGPLFAGRLPDPATGVDCATLTVPEDRRQPGGRRVVLPVVILRAPVQPAKPDPVVFIPGGPGDGAIEISKDLVQGRGAADRDLILFDQRGTGRATPSLDCPEVDAATWKNAEATDADDMEFARTDAAYRACYDRLRTIADLEQYNTPTTAADMADLRDALKLPAWNLYGISYGTAVGLEVLRSQPAGVRSALLDSVVPPYQRADPRVTAPDGVFTDLIAGCQKDPACAARYPHLADDIIAIRAALNANPHRVSLTDPSGTPRTANLTGDDVINGAFLALYNSSLIPLIPSFVAQLLAGNNTVLDAVGPALLATQGSGSEGLGVTVNCADRQAFEARLDRSLTRAAKPLIGPFLVAPRFPDICDTWKVGPVDAGFQVVSESSVPVLVLGDEYDPATPHAGSKDVAARLGRLATYVEFPGLGHVATAAGHPCPTSMRDTFFAEPTAAVDTACVAGMAEPAWST